MFELLLLMAKELTTVSNLFPEGGNSIARLTIKGCLTACSMPQRCNSPSLSRNVLMRRGAASGLPALAAKKSRGCGSKLSTADGTPRCRASLFSSASIAWCPRCTPSKLPIVSAQPPGISVGAAVPGAGSRWIFMRWPAAARRAGAGTGPSNRQRARPSRSARHAP